MSKKSEHYNDNIGHTKQPTLPRYVGGVRKLLYNNYTRVSDTCAA